MASVHTPDQAPPGEILPKRKKEKYQKKKRKVPKEKKKKTRGEPARSGAERFFCGFVRANTTPTSCHAICSYAERVRIKCFSHASI
jgi:hypothetical protein